MLSQSTYTKEFTFNDTTRTATVTITLDLDDTDPEGDFDIGDAEDNAVYLSRFESGELLMCSISVEATFGIFSGSDHLGACHISTESFEEDSLTLVSEHQMIKEALNELIQDITLTKEIVNNL